MARSFYSTVLDHSAVEVWAVIRDFGHYAWAGVPGVTVIEDGKSGDQIGAVRHFTSGERSLRQVLLAHSDIERCYTYAFVGEAPFPVRNYVATIRITPEVDSGKAFIEWWATFDCAADELDHWAGYFERYGFAVWLGALRTFMAAEGATD